MRRRKWFFAALALLLVGLTLPVWAHGFPRGGPGQDGPRFGHGGPPFGGILGRLIYPCQAACFEGSRDCFETADSEALACITAPCSTEIAAAQSACASDRRAAACHDAVHALRDCGDSCLESRDSAFSACRATVDDCRSKCDGTQE